MTTNPTGNKVGGERQRFGASSEDVPRAPIFVDRLPVNGLARTLIYHSRVFHLGDRAPLPISHTVQNRVSEVSHARKHLTDRGKSSAKRKGKKQSVWLQASLPTPALNERGWHNLNRRRGGGARKPTLEVVASCVSQCWHTCCWCAVQKCDRITNHQRKRKRHWLDLSSENLQSLLTWMLPMELGAQGASN